MDHVTKIVLEVLLLSMQVGVGRATDSFELSKTQNISCGRSFAPGKFDTATCTSYTYLFNTKTSEYFRCQVSMAITRDNKEMILVSTDGHCTRKLRIFPDDSRYSFDAAESEPPNTNSSFGHGGYSIWAADTTQRNVRGCITISSRLGYDVSRCVDTTFRQDVTAASGRHASNTPPRKPALEPLGRMVKPALACQKIRFKPPCRRGVPRRPGERSHLRPCPKRASR
jgi:hypothetical protein